MKGKVKGKKRSRISNVANRYTESEKMILEDTVRDIRDNKYTVGQAASALSSLRMKSRKRYAIYQRLLLMLKGKSTSTTQVKQKRGDYGYSNEEHELFVSSAHTIVDQDGDFQACVDDLEVKVNGCTRGAITTKLRREVAKYRRELRDTIKEEGEDRTITEIAPGSFEMGEHYGVTINILRNVVVAQLTNESSDEQVRKVAKVLFGVDEV